MDAPSLLTFCDEIGILGKEAAVDRVRAVAASAPHGLLARLAARRGVGRHRQGQGRAVVGRGQSPVRCIDSVQLAAVSTRPVRRETVAQLAEALDDDRLRWWASPDVAWDRIVSIEPAGETRVIDFTVPEVHNFVAADLYLHNTAFGLGIATHVAKHSSRPVLVFSLEMGHVELTQRILASEAEVDSQKIRNGRLSEADWAKIGRAIGRLEVPLFLDDNPRVTVMEIRAKARRLKMQHGDLGLILVDYLQLMSSGGNAENRQLEVSEISRNLKILARELEVPIVALSQLSRNLESRSDKHPMLSDLRESGSLEQDADVVIFLYRDEVYNKESPDRGAADVIVAKHRAGPDRDDAVGVPRAVRPLRQRRPAVGWPERRHPERVFLGDDLLAWLVLALGGALFIGNVFAIVRPPERPEEDALERAPLGRSLLMAAVGLVGAVWALATLITS